MLKIRLSRIGRKNAPAYRIIVSDRAKDTYGTSLEIVGFYNPILNKFSCQADRIKHWISLGAQTSATLNNLLVSNKIIDGKKQKSSSLTKKRLAQINEKKLQEEAKKQETSA